MRSVAATRFLTFLVPLQSTLPPLMSLSGHSPIHELNAPELRNFEKSGPNSARIVCTCKTLMPGMVVRSTPRIRYASSRRAKALTGFMTLHFLTESLAAGKGHRGIGLRFKELHQSLRLGFAVHDFPLVFTVERNRLAQSDKVFLPVIGKQA